MYRGHIFFAVFAGLTACGSDNGSLALEQLGSVAEPLVASSAGCSIAELRRIRDARRIGQWIVQTDEFSACVDQRGYYGGLRANVTVGTCRPDDNIACWRTYVPDAGDAAQGGGVWAAQVAANNPMHVECADVPPSADGGLRAVALNAGAKVEFEGTEQVRIDHSRLRETDLPAELAGILFHESMHVHGFNDGGGNPNSMNDVVGRCVEQLITGTDDTEIFRTRLRDYGLLTPARTALLRASALVGGIAHGFGLDSAINGLAFELQVVARHSGMCLAALGASEQEWRRQGQRVGQIQCPGLSRGLGPNHVRSQWRAMPLDDLPRVSGAITWVLLNSLVDGPGAGNCLDRPNGRVANGTRLQVSACNAGPSQRWIWRASQQWEAVTAGGAASGQCLTIPAASGVQNGVALMSKCKTTNFANQAFDTRN